MLLRFCFKGGVCGDLIWDVLVCSHLLLFLLLDDELEAALLVQDKCVDLLCGAFLLCQPTHPVDARQMTLVYVSQRVHETALASIDEPW